MDSHRPADAASRHPLADAFEVLVVDDEPEVRELLADYFSGQGFSVTRASDGRGAMLALDRYPGRFGLVITDLTMPGADGFAVLHEARRANPRCYVVIVTGYASLDSAIQAVRAGAYDYLPKPFALGQLDVILNRLADHAALERASRERTSYAPLLVPSPRRPVGAVPLTSAMLPAEPDRPTVEMRLAAIERVLDRVERRLVEHLESASRR